MTHPTTTSWDDLGKVRPALADLYRDLHEHPELSLQEHRSAALLAGHLRTAGFETTEQVGGTGVVGVLRNGAGPVVMLRADFDALPVEEKTGLPYASTVRAVDAEGQDVPVMHACGHDMHAACLVGAATLLAAEAG
ncbi:M20/M25/M40 family metallo-hydrolase, partial [Streptomyces sp. SID5785]|uniref:M20/M25/M40 family metallo-hydrolase n=1 Tax=Streptomyces sp. SID5785 TaxID=2690309 RepID=UPI001361076A